MKTTLVAWRTYLKIILGMAGRLVALITLVSFGVIHAKEYHRPYTRIIVHANNHKPSSLVTFSHIQRRESTHYGPLLRRTDLIVSNRQTRVETLKVASGLQSEDTPRTNAEAPQSMDLETLTSRLKKTRAVGFLTKLSLKNEIDGLVKHIQKHHASKSDLTYEQLRERFDLLLLKVLTLLQDKDKELAKDISDAREAIWGAFVNNGKVEST